MTMPSETRPPPPEDQAGRDQIIRDLERTFLVEAGAGTGKTTSLVGRMVALLASGKCTTETVAAVTFTRKAAAELRDRFQLDLERAMRKATGTERERLHTALDHVERCTIGTIHSFCGRLLRERPVEAGVDVAFREIDEAEDKLFREQAWRGFVAELHADGDPRLEDLERLGIEIDELMSAFLRFADYPDVEHWPTGQATLPALEPAVQALTTYALDMEALASTFPDETANDPLMRLYRLIPRLIRRSDLSTPVALMEVLCHFKVDRPIVQRNWPGKGAQAKAELARWNDFTQQYADPYLNTWRQHRYGPVLLVLQAAADRYAELRRQAGCLNFQDLLMKAAGLLRGRPEIRRYFRERFTHLLVDEFQDTDPIQAEVILLLTADDPNETDWRRCRPKPGTLFVVGDPKQSIYRFRRADIVTYNLVKDIIRSSGGEVIELWVNFRSIQPIVDWVNATFRDVFPEKATAEMPARRPLATGRPECEGELVGIRYLHLGGNNNDDVSTEDARAIANNIAQALAAGQTVPRSAKEISAAISSHVRPEDFLIITRRKDRLSLYGRALQERGIPHQVTGGSAWNEVSELALLRDCLKALLCPHDEIALLTVLRGELFGFSDQALYDFHEAGGRFSLHCEPPSRLDAVNRDLFEGAFDRLCRYRHWFGRLPPLSVIERIVADLGLGARAAAADGGNVQAGTLHKALAWLRSAQLDLHTPVELMEYLDELIQTDGDFDGVPARPHSTPPVRLMNLHKVKGLEAPVVFLADPSGESKHPVRIHVDRSGNRVEGFLAVYDQSGNQLLACGPGWDAREKTEQAFADAEEKRLLYVAATRAGSQISITQRNSYTHRDPWKFFEVHESGSRPLQDPGPVTTKLPLARPITEVEQQQACRQIRERCENACQRSYAKRRVRDALSSTQAHAPTGGEHGTEWGTVIHRLLEAAMRSAQADLPGLAHDTLMEQGLETDLALDALKLVAQVMSSSIWKRARGGQAALTEVPIQELLSEDGMSVLQNGVIDLVFRERDGWVIVDYKTDRQPSSRLAGLVEHYRPQLASYMAGWRRATGEPVKEGGFYFTHAGQYVVL